MEFAHVLVVGAGQMGGGIAQVVAASGRRVSLHDELPGAAEKAHETMQRSLEKLAAKGGASPSAVLERVEAVTSLVPADLMIEAVVEDADVKKTLFRQADEILPPAAVLASNTSSIPISSLAAVTGRPDKVIGMHFFNPVPVLELVEVISADETSDETRAAIVRLAEDLGKVPAEARDSPGFVSNRILMPFLNEAATCHGGRRRAGGDRHHREARVRPPAGAARARRSHRARHVRGDHGGPARGPRRREVRSLPAAREHVAAGRLGRKSGRGFYEYA